MSRGRSSSLKLSDARTPVQCTGSPIDPCSSHSSTPWPRRAICSAAYSPAGPPPTTRTSTLACGMCEGIISASFQPLHFWLARFPRAAPGDPEREHDQLEIETEARAPQIQPIEPKLAGARDVARRIDLGQSRQSRTDAMPGLVTGNRRERNHLSVAADLDLARTQRPRPDEAHVAGENIPELRQFVHRRAAQH